MECHFNLIIGIHKYKQNGYLFICVEELGRWKVTNMRVYDICLYVLRNWRDRKLLYGCLWNMLQALRLLKLPPKTMCFWQLVALRICRRILRNC